MAKQHESVFTYSLTRPYPFRWFSWAVIIGGAIAIVLFSVLNYAANAFSLVSHYTTDPNSTTTEVYWFNKPPFNLVQKYTSTCQAQELPVNSQLFTSNLGFTYTLVNVTTTSADGQVDTAPALTYLNNTLSQCQIPNMMMYAVNSRTIGNEGVYTGGINPTEITLHVDYSPEPNTASVGGVLPSPLRRRDKVRNANLWWANELLYSSHLATAYYFATTWTDPTQEFHTTVTNARIEMTQNSTYGLYDIKYFDVACDKWMADGYYGYYFPGTDITSACYFSLNSSLDTLTKIFYSSVLADLGAIDSPNVLTNKTYIQNRLDWLYGTLTSFNIINENSTGPLAFNRTVAQKDGLATDDLTVKNTTIYSQYLCQVPVRKSTGTMLIAVIVADLVLLQALWSIFVFCVSLSLNQDDRKAHHCEGCIRRQQREGMLIGGGNEDFRTDVDDDHIDGHSDAKTVPVSVIPMKSFSVTRKPVSTRYEPLSSGVDTRMQR